jgi:hypothetical protein
MGLTIHYRLQSDTRTAKEARRLVGELRKKALDLPFAEVGEVTELKGDGCDYRTYDGNDPLRWLAIQARQYVETGGTHYPARPVHVVAFSACPGEGCEVANFGLATYPLAVFVRDPKERRSRKARTGLKGWCWSSFCKTQYASGHGLDHFLRCHLSVVRMLDHAKELGILASVNDEGGFWEKRDVKSLAQQVGEWNQGMAALVGQLKDMFGGDFEAPITKYADFERLEARGKKRK